MRNTLLKLLLPAAVCWVMACNKATDIPASPDVAHVMIYNGSTAFTAKSSRVFVDTAFITTRSYNDINGSGMGVFNPAAYNWLAPGSHRVGFTDTSWQTKIAEKYTTLDKDKWYTFYLADSLGYYQVLMSEENINDRPENKARIRFVHLSPDSGPLDFFIDTGKVAGLDSMVYKTITPFVEVPAAENPSFRVKRTGAAEDEPHLVRKTFATFPGRSYTFIFRGYIQQQGEDPNTTVNMSAILNF
ncbi:DUF4397 domain-containing protein [Chitinophaga sp. 22620]|uniref:DUF4397 domain-containing protein n=1 Tax=Chitinophaga sp. 22620 TaxID=3453952 RepID=UPI003F878453